MNKESFAKIYYYLKKEKKYLFLFLIIRLLMTSVDIYSPLLIKSLVDKALPEKNISLLFQYSVILIILYLFRLIFAISSQFNGKLMGSKIKKSMRDDLTKKILYQPSSFFQKNNSGDLISRVMNDLDSISTLCHRGLEDFIFSFITIFASIFIMFDFSYKLTIISLIPLPIILIFVYHENLKMKKGYRKIRKDTGLLTSSLHDILKTIFFLKDNHLEKSAIKDFENSNSTLFNSEKSNMIPSSLLVSSVTFYSNITQLIIILAGGYLYIKNSVSMGVILSFLLLVDRFRLRIMRMVGLIDIYQKGISGLHRFVEIIKIPPIKDGEVNLTQEIHSIEFKNISFSFNENLILNNFNLKINKGEKIAIVGKSGIGKSTTANLLKKAITPSKGDIFINNIPLDNIKRESYLNKLGIVDQGEYILNKTIIENIKLVKSSATNEEINFAFNNSYLKEIIDLFDEKENTLVGEKGIFLSSGQKQKIAMARLFLKNPDIILLDEATNALDIINENSILKNIKEVYKNKTIIAITHRLSILKDFDKIYVIDKNNIIEEGSFSDLLSKKSHFYKLYNGIRE